MILWNEIDYETQVKVMGIIEEALLKQKELPVQDALIAALNELEVWSNSPCPIVEDFNIVDAQDPYYD